MLITHRKHSNKQRVVIGRGMCKCRDNTFVYGKGFCNNRRTGGGPTGGIIGDLISGAINLGRIGKDVYNISKDAKDIHNGTSVKEAEAKRRIAHLVNDIIGSGFKTCGTSG